jgi:Homeodomain-like domain
VDASPDDGAGVAVADCVGVREGSVEHRGRGESGGVRETVRKWRSRFVRDRLEGLTDVPRPGTPRKITDEQVERVITATLEQKPPQHDTPWSTRSIATATGMSQSAISRIWRAFDWKPHLVETWKLSTRSPVYRQGP